MCGLPTDGHRGFGVATRLATVEAAVEPTMRETMRVCMVSHRSGGFDGVATMGSQWSSAFTELGWRVTHVAGRFDQPVDPCSDVALDSLWAPVFGGRPPEPDRERIDTLVRTHDLLVLDNIGSYPSAVLAAIAFEESALRHGVPTIVRHHDPTWQVTAWRALVSESFPLHNPRMLHLTVNKLTESQFRTRYPELAFHDAVSTAYSRVSRRLNNAGDRAATRAQLGVDPDDILLSHPARNIDRKNIPAALELARNLSALTTRRIHYWLTSPEGALPDAPGVHLHRGNVDDAADLYAASDFIVLTSFWEGWGLPVVEAAAAGKLVATYPYPVLGELHDLGITTIDCRDAKRVMDLINDSEEYRKVAESNQKAARQLDVSHLTGCLAHHAARANHLMLGTMICA